jgi:hypothetical protein
VSLGAAKAPRPSCEAGDYCKGRCRGRLLRRRRLLQEASPSATSPTPATTEEVSLRAPRREIPVEDFSLVFFVRDQGATHGVMGHVATSGVGGCGVIILRRIISTILNKTKLSVTPHDVAIFRKDILPSDNVRLTNN